MQPNGSTSSGVRALSTAPIAAVVGAVVLGILGMHGLSQHGAMPSHVDGQTVAATTSTDSHAGHAASNAAATVTINQIEIMTTTTGNAGGSAGHVAVLCAAMVLAAAAGVLLVLRLRRPAPSTALRVKSDIHAVRHLVSNYMDTGPPAVWEFSVVRC